MSGPNYNALAASNGSGEPVRIVLTAPRSIGSTTLTGNTPTNWPTGTYIATTGTLQSNGTLNPATAQVFYGTVSGSNLTITAFASGYTDLGNAIGDVVVIKPTTEWANVVAEGIQSTTQFPAQFANFVEPGGGVWSISSGLIGTMTAGNVWYNGVRSVIPVVTTKTFTASKDTYVDFNPATSAFTYVPVTNGAAEPAVTASSLRIAKIVTSGSAITSISQQAYQKAVPLVWQYLGSAQITGNITTTSGTDTQMTGLTTTISVPASATKVRVTGFLGYISESNSANVTIKLWTGVVGSGTVLATVVGSLTTGVNFISFSPIALIPASAGSVTYNISWSVSAGTGTLNASSTAPSFILAECC